MVFVTFIFLAIIVYLEVTNNSMFESMSHYFVGDTESEITIEEVISYEKQEIKDENLDEGVTETRQEGKDGKKKIIFRVTMDKDGNEIDRTYIGEEIITEAVDKIIAIGTKVPTPSANNNSGGQGGWSDNSGSQPSNSGSGSNNSSQPSNGGNNSNSGSNNGPTIHYCTSSTPYWHWEGEVEYDDEGYWHYSGGTWSRYYYKTNYPCSEFSQKSKLWFSATYEVSSSQYYSLEKVEYNNGPAGYLLEARIEYCGYGTEGFDPSCKTY